MKNLYLTLVLTIVAHSIVAQNVKSDLLAINKAMKAESYTASMEYKSYIDKVLSETLKSKITVSKGCYKFTLGGITKINTDKLNLTLDHANGLMVVTKTEKLDEKLRKLPPLDSFLARAETVKFSKKDQTGTYTFTLKGFREKTVEVDFDMTNFQVRRIYTVMAEKLVDDQQRQHEKAFEVIYHSYQKDIPIDKSVFNTSQYVVKRSKTFIATAKYSKYRIVDMIYNKE